MKKVKVFLEVDVQYLKKLYEIHDDLHCFPKTMKIEKVKKLAKYVIHIRSL